MKTKLITAALLLSTAYNFAQTDKKAPCEKKEMTVRIKKVENINGVEKITDTTYTTSAIHAGDAQVKIIESGDGDKHAKVIVVESETGDVKGHSDVKIIKKGDGMDEEIEKALKEAGVDLTTKEGTKMVVINEDIKGGEKKGTKTITKIVMIRTDLSEASSSELKKAGIPEPKNKLVIEDMNCTPNPSNGKFNLKFTSPDKSTADISVRDINGKIVYTESVKDFTGLYDKEINLDSSAKGIYFVSIMQGKKSTTKKLIVE